MRNIQITEGALWYWEIRRRESVNINSDLRTITLNTIKEARQILKNGTTPLPIEDKTRCRACSLYDICLPHTFIKDGSENYINHLFSLDNI